MKCGAGAFPHDSSSEVCLSTENMPKWYAIEHVADVILEIFFLVVDEVRDLIAEDHDKR